MEIDTYKSFKDAYWDYWHREIRNMHGALFR